MKNVKTPLAIALLVFATSAAAGNGGHKPRHQQYDHAPQQQLFDFARVVDVQPIYREVQVRNPVSECWDEPVYETRREHKSAGGMLAGGLIGGIIGHQFGKGRGKRVATAVGTLIGAQVGHDAVNGHGHAGEQVVAYEQQCRTRHQVSYEQVVDGYDVTYKYRGQRYHVEMPYDPGKRIKMRIQITPVI